jgi:hypothetical protein
MEDCEDIEIEVSQVWNESIVKKSEWWSWIFDMMLGAWHTY